MKKQVSNRADWIDVSRGIGIFFVVLIHTGRLENAFIINSIKSFVLPFFFFISGLLIKESIYNYSLSKLALRLSKRILVPYLTFSIISYFSWVLLFKEFKDQDFYYLKSIAAIAYGSAGGGGLNFNIALWFFPCFYLSQIIVFFVIKESQKNYNYLILSLFFLSIIGYLFTKLFSNPRLYLPWGLEIAITAAVFSGVGFSLRSYVYDAINWKKTTRFLWLLIFFIFWLIMSKMNSVVEFYVGFYGNYFLFYGASLSGIGFWILVSQSLEKNIFLRFMGQNSLTIFPTHLLVIPLVTGFLVYVIKIPESIIASGALVALGYSLIAVFSVIPLSNFINEKAPVLIGKK